MPVVSGLFLSTVPLLLHAQAPSAGYTAVRIEYQHIRTGVFYNDSPLFSSGGEVGNTDAHAFIFSGDYAFDEHWMMFASLPVILRRHSGLAPHNFAEFVTFDPPDRTLVDDGDYHGGFQDFSIGIQYGMNRGPLRISPFISFGIPTNDYPFYGKAIIGNNLWHIPVGVQLDFQPYFSDWSFSSGITYVISQRPLNVNVNYWLIDASAGYYFTHRLFGSVFATHRETPNGLKLPDDFTDSPTFEIPEDFDTELWWQHDRVLAHSFTNIGIGIDYVLNEKYQLAGKVFTTVDAKQTNEIEYALAFALTIRFDRK